MGTHPNAILMAHLTPDDLSRKTMRAILAEAGVEDDNDIPIGQADYHHLILDGDWDDGYQIGGQEGDLVFFDFVTYGYGEQVAWDDLEKQKNDLEAWAKATSEKHHCAYRISVSANYW